MSARAAKPSAQAIQGPSRLLVIAADVVAAIAVTLFATDLFRPGVPYRTQLLVALWAALPRVVAECIEQPRSLFRTRGSLVKARALAVMGVVLGLTATRFALASIPSIGAKSEFEMVLVIACWAAGFALRDPATYRVYEPLCSITLVAGLLNDCAQALVLVPVAFLALAFSAALRHQLGHAAVSRRVRRVSIKNAAVAAVMLGVLVAGIFATARTGLRAIVVPRAASSRSSAADDALDDPSRYDDSADEPGDFADPDGTPGWALTPHGAGRSGGLGLGPRDVARGGPGEIIQHVLVPQPQGALKEVPTPDTLWRARTYVRFDGDKEQWIDQGLSFWTRPPMLGATLLRNPPELGREPVAWVCEVMTEGVDSLLVPYFASEVRFEAASPEGVDLRVNGDGDVSAEGGELGRGRKHRILLRPFDAAHPAIGDVAAGVSPSEDYLEIPRATTKLGALVREVARNTLDRDAGLAEKIRSLEWFITRSYRYRLNPRSGPLPTNLTDFLARTHAGDCRHIASAAVLFLRASGVPARLAEGFAGVEPAEEGPGWIVRNSWAHVWVEVLSQKGWIPIDATRWVAPTLGRNPASAGAGDPSPRPDRRGKIGGPDETDDPALVRKDRFNPIDNPLILIIFTSVAALAVILMIAKSWRRAPEREPEEKDEEDPEVAIADATPLPGRAFNPRTPAEHLLLDYANMQDDLSLSGQERQSHETPREHAQRVASGSGEPSAPAFGSLVPLVDDGLYGHADLTEGDLATGRGAIQSIKKVLK